MGNLVKRSMWENKITKNRVYVLKREQKHVLVEYVKSGTKSWYEDADFNRMFQLVFE